MNDVTARARWTQKYAVGFPASSKARPLPSFQRFFAKVTQITQDHTPNASRNQETRRLSFMGRPSGWVAVPSQYRTGLPWACGGVQVTREVG
ncbi:DUF5136 domain-containing protein [Streptomyces venezuelae ATCC 10712]|nr:DUF5136 domain-containing protein [Streptomyces venezuelae ATCC 10712]